MPQILKALEIAKERGLNLPIVYNTSGYESIEALKLLDGIVDIYLTDMRYSDDRPAIQYSIAPHYWFQKGGRDDFHVVPRLAFKQC